LERLEENAVEFCKLENIASGVTQKSWKTNGLVVDDYFVEFRELCVCLPVLVIVMPLFVTVAAYVA